MGLNPKNYPEVEIDAGKLKSKGPLEGKIDTDMRPKRTGKLEERNPKAKSAVTFYLTNKNLLGIKECVKKELIRSGKREEDITEKDYRGKMAQAVDQILTDWLSANNG